MKVKGLPPKQGLYDPLNEKDSCGVGFIAHIKGVRSHEIIKKGIELLDNLTHRGATGADPKTGDGAGILIQIPHEFFARECSNLGFALPEEGSYGVGMLFLPTDEKERQVCIDIIEEKIRAEGQTLLGWRDVPIDENSTGDTAREAMPSICQVFIESTCKDQLAFERKLFVIRKQIGFKIRPLYLKEDKLFHIPSMSSRTIVYKGQLIAAQVPCFFKDLSDETMKSALALVHQRYSTNTFPSWDLAHPFRYLAHNGEINTLRGNINWMFSREAMFESELFGEDIKKLTPIIRPYSSDSFGFDNALELLVMSGRSLPHAMMMLVPEAWSKNVHMDADKRAFYEFHAAKMEPWDGPAALAFTDGKVIGATLDRNGLRPARYTVTKDDFIILASESGVLPVEPENVLQNWRLQPGKILVVDLEQGRIIDDEEVKEDIVKGQPYRKWVDENRITMADLPTSPAGRQPDHKTLMRRQKAFGYTIEEIHDIITPMAINGQEPLGAMGNDTPLAVLSDKPQLLYNYFKQLFAQVTNPPIDPIREELVMSLTSYIGAEGNLLDERPADCHRLELSQPILTNLEMAKLREVNVGKFKTTTISTLFEAKSGIDGLKDALNRICLEADSANDEGNNVIVLSDWGLTEGMAALPALLATATVHHHLIRTGTRGKVGLIVESGEPREVHHFALLIGYGAGAVNPYLVFETLEDLYVHDYLPEELEGERDAEGERKAESSYIKAVGKGLLKVFSKMGISTLQSFNGAQIFEAVGLNSDVIECYFTGTPSRIEGVGIDTLAEEVIKRHSKAYPKGNVFHLRLDHGGQYQWRRDGEEHTMNPETLAKFQYAVRMGDYETFKEYSSLIDDQSRRHYTLRGLFEFKTDASNSIPLDEVEPVSEIVKRFASGAMSFGSISKEAHETLAIAMNRLGGRSNSGEGGEDPLRFTADENGDLRRSAIKQVASGRFGVTSHYLVNADELQIKMAQGAKPGEGGQLPGHKVDEVIARVRHSTPGVGLISPPPHHDIYSIEDLAQLIHDLKNSNNRADISVKLVAEVGVGTIAAGVSKAKAEKVLISGYDGGTGASPVSSIKHAGLPWELGLSETQQTLVLNDLRGRIKVQVDGQLKTGRDVAIGALLGADEFGFATTALISMGCIMLRKCHLNTCSVGVATQDPELRKKFTGKPEHVVNFLTFIAEELREIMAELGIRTIDEMTGRADLLDTRKAVEHWKAKGLDLSSLLHVPKMPKNIATRNIHGQDHELEKALDNELLNLAKPALEGGEKVAIALPIRNINRTVGTLLGSEISRRYGGDGLPDDTITCTFRGTAGQSFGAFVPKGVTLILEGDANDYVGKGLSGGRLVVRPPHGSTLIPEENIIAGNTILYGATRGELFLNGIVGERFCVRNSGANAVVEGVGDHGCEYMTGGRVVVLGETGRNFAAGMSGGIAYVLNEFNHFEKLCNMSMVDLERVEDKEEETFVKGLIEKHLAFTGSPKAKAILDDWQAFVQRFVKVMPIEYRRVLDKQEREQAVKYG
ncbi:MAG: glutamate synthase large subunit [Proteobacteria bacterium]|nr:glutamate synthase large subunit [Pseudomonadota bacterium]